MDAMRGPITDIAKQQGREAMLNFDSITGAFDLKMQIAITIGVDHLQPGLALPDLGVPRARPDAQGAEVRRSASSSPPSRCSSPGCVRRLAASLPHIVQLLTSFAPEADSAIIDAKTYYDFVLKLVLAVGIAFVLPVFLVLLNFVGVLSAKSIIESWRWALILIVLFTAIATPAADVISMFLLAIPMVVLYFAAYGVAWLHDRRAAKVADRLEAELAA